MAQRPSYLAVSASAHPLVKLLFSEMLRQGVSLSDLAVKSGVDRNTISRWRVSGTMTLVSMESCLQAVGFGLMAAKTPVALAQAHAKVAALQLENAILRNRIAAAGRQLGLSC